MFAEGVAGEARTLDLEVIEVGVGVRIEELTQLVAQALGLARPCLSPSMPL